MGIDGEAGDEQLEAAPSVFVVERAKIHGADRVDALAVVGDRHPMAVPIDARSFRRIRRRPVCARGRAPLPRHFGGPPPLRADALDLLDHGNEIRSDRLDPAAVVLGPERRPRLDVDVEETRALELSRPREDHQLIDVEAIGPSLE